MSNDRKALAQLLKAAKDLQADLLRRAEWDDDCQVVCAGAGAWARFCNAIDDAEKERL